MFRRVPLAASAANSSASVNRARLEQEQQQLQQQRQMMEGQWAEEDRQLARQQQLQSQSQSHSQSHPAHAEAVHHISASTPSPGVEHAASPHLGGVVAQVGGNPAAPVAVAAVIQPRHHLPA